jgi:hypothetical protein
MKTILSRRSHSFWGIFLTASSLLLLPETTRSQSPVSQTDLLTAAEEKDSYEIYSILLRDAAMEGTRIAIAQNTRAFTGNLDVCLKASNDGKSAYSPVIENYIVKNATKATLERKFDSPRYSLVGPAEVKAILEGRRSPSADPSVNDASVIFHVSAVGFNPDRTRALVHVGHYCGNMCGGGQYHLLIKKDGKWQADHEYRGTSCGWVS